MLPRLGSKRIHVEVGSACELFQCVWNGSRAHSAHEMD